jgi:uncharacterized protein (DUF3084 family)
LQAAEKAAAAEHSKLKQELSVTQAEQKKIDAELQAKLKEMHTAQQLADQNKINLKDAHGENEMLVQQMHHVQEELECYFMENRQLQETLEQSHDSLNRARRLVSRLVMQGAAVPEVGLMDA